jgi:hypothetical protein
MKYELCIFDIFFKNARRIWLGKWDSSQNPKPEAGNRQKIEQFMRMKYDQKKFYVPPEVEIIQLN